jgi:hypothetical protein
MPSILSTRRNGAGPIASKRDSRSLRSLSMQVNPPAPVIGRSSSGCSHIVRPPVMRLNYVVVQDLSRFARNHKDQAEAIWDLGRCGVLLRSTYESNIDETAAGKLAANIFGAFNQFFSDSHSEKQRDRKRQAVAAGRVPWRAPIGYVNVSSKVGANVEPDPQRGPLITRAFRTCGYSAP